MNKDSSISHVSKDCKRVQTNEKHLEGVAKLADTFASAFGMGKWGEVIGRLHDLGKERENFQNYIKKVSGLDTSANWYGQDKRHAYVGALMAKELYKTFYHLISFPIMGHHGGLDNYSDFERKMKENFPKDVKKETFVENLQIPEYILSAVGGSSTKLGRFYHHIIRMLYSCLVDADYLDTESFMDSDSYKLRGSKTTLSELYPRLRAYLETLKTKAAKSQLNDIRNMIQERCRETATCPPGFYSLTVPTGGGKTLSSILWAMLHAIKYGKKRIILAIPYTSIVTQTAQTLSDIFGQDNVLEHHSSVEYKYEQTEEMRHRIKLATENWDYPIIVTTNVQLFTSMYSNRPSVCRKLHNIAQSVILLDEPQTLPVEQMQPIIDALICYNELFSTSILLTTASQPYIKGEIKSNSATLFGIADMHEIIPKEWNLHEKLRRVDIQIIEDEQTHESIASEMVKHDRVLCIVNTRKDAQKIYEALPKEGMTIHLSRMMCSAHLRKNIAAIKSALADAKQQIIRVVSTQLLEAGVDIDFPIVYRQEAGLDSILQAAGRCNREGKMPSSNTYVFSLTNKLYGQIRRGAYAFKSLPPDIDYFSTDAMNQYFLQLYSRVANFDKSGISDALYNPIALQFEDAAQQFRLIDADGSTVVYVNYEDSSTLITRLIVEGPSYPLLKQLSKYSVNIHMRDFNELAAAGLINVINGAFYYIEDKKQYDDKIGLVTNNHWLDEILMVSE